MNAKMNAERDSASAELEEIPELASLGAVFRTIQPIQLTETETEYVVRYKKHVLVDYVVLEFIITNTLPEHLLADICESS